jgi:O-antigen ligase
VLFLVVPVTYRLMTNTRANTLTTVVVTCAAASAAFGIVQYGILHYDNLGQRPQGTLGHWMTYSGLLMIVIGVAAARVLFARSDRTWAALVLPALAVAIAVTFTRGAAVGACAAIALLFAMKDFRLFALLPILAAIFIVAAPGQIAKRYASMFNMNDPTVRDRVTMMRIGGRMVQAHPLSGIGPNMVERSYVGYRGPDSLVGPDGVVHINPHLHNNLLQIAAERGLPALAIWLWFIIAMCRDLQKRFASGSQRFLAAAGLAATAAVVTAGLFEYNFGDSEVLMLFLIVATLPAAADRSAAA